MRGRRDSALARTRSGKGRGNRGSAASIFMLSLALAAVVALLAGFLWFAGRIPDAIERPEQTTDAIVVLTGGSERLAQGFRLLAEHKAQKLFVSGVYRGVEVRELLERSQRRPESLSCCVTLGYEADDTRGNAIETAAWMAANGFASLRLVTAAYHMPRSLLEFRRAMPNLEIIAHPVFPETFKHRDWWRWPGTTTLLAREYVKYLFAHLRASLDGLSSL